MKIVCVVVALLAAVLGLGVYKTLTEPGHLYKHSGEFGACPARPSCVSSVADSGSEHHIPGLPALPLDQVANAIQAAGGRIVQRDADYLHAVFVTERMRYHDDVEVRLGPSGLDWRSVSRFGYRDFGVNRARLEALRADLLQPAG